MLETKRIIWYLRKIPLFSTLPSTDLERLAEVVTVREVRRREVVYLPGDPGEGVMFVHSGRVKISKVTRDGKSLTLAYVGAGDAFGEMALVSGGPRTEMAEAVENVLLTECAGIELERVMLQHPAVGLAASKMLISRRNDLENKVEALVFRDVASKLAELLVQLGLEYGVEDARGTLLAVKFTHQELANLIGSTRETVSLTLSLFKRRSLIATDGRKVILSDANALRAMF